MKTKKKDSHIVNPWFFIIAGIFISLIAISHATTVFNREVVEATQTLTTTPVPKARVKLDFGNGTVRMFESDMGHQKYPLGMALQSVAATGNFTFTLTNDRITEIAGVKNNSSHVWKVYQNEKPQ